MEGVTSGNGRIEAVQIDIAVCQSGRVVCVEVDEGELVRADQALMRMNTESLQAQLEQAEISVKQAENEVGSARSQLVQPESEKVVVQVLVTQRQTELSAAQLCPDVHCSAVVVVFRLMH